MFNFDEFARDVATKAPFKQGWTPSTERPGDANFSIPQASYDIASAPSLAYLQKDFVLFNHGALIVFSPTPGDPLRRYCTFNKLSGPVFALASPFPILAGLGEPWDRMVMGCPREDWPGIQKYLDTDTALRRQQNLLVRPLGQSNFPVVDFLQLQRHTILPDKVPTVLIELYGIDSNHRCIHFKPAIRPMLELPKAVFDKPLPETVELAGRILSGQEHPFEQVRA